MGKPKIILRPTPVLQKQIGQLRKLFGLWENSKIKDPIKRELNPSVGAMKDGIPEFLSQSRGVRTTHVTRRQIVLNRHFTEIISDVLATNFKKQLDNLGVSITSIETKSWNKGVGIYYKMDKPFDEQTHSELNKLVPELRYAITERRLIGRTPHVGFVFDRSVYIDKMLTEALSKVNLDEKVEKQLTTTNTNQVYISKDLGSEELKLISKRFVAPTDMDNTLFGLDYPTLYDEVALKLSQGRGELSRIRTNTAMLSEAKPLFRAPKEDHNEEDPVKRILQMKKFLVSQKQKNENQARSRRKMEIMTRNSVKWQIIDDEDLEIRENDTN